ncbi:MAG: tRNA dihydrouridine synthase DusB [Candidatus Eremiobacteraeota bacterium]|nr:tRNA dihydrouridine synthase DusB [Candidatus Eremiobacteraeota bacterium]
MFLIKETPKTKSFYIKNVLIPNPIILAPMAGITDMVFRSIIKKMGAGLVYSEMISCNALHYGNQKTLSLMDFDKSETPIAIQIFGTDPQLMSEAAKMVEDAGASIVDINLGCSVPKIIKSGAGAILCRDSVLLGKILEDVVRAVSIPVTIKIRKGWSNQELNAAEVCRIAGECGIGAIAVHGRTSAQKFSGEADWDFIKKLKESTNLPLIGNGDIKTPGQAVEMLEFSQCDGIMIGREAYYNPWIFKQSLEHLEISTKLKSKEELPDYSTIPNLTLEDRKNLILYHLECLVKRYGEDRGVRKMRKFAAWQTRGLPASACFRDKVFYIEAHKDMIELIDSYFMKSN